ncbi:MAG: hypothetical protein NZL83_03415 [Candidatus Absconditabacterales bacterium]|nr:hypothetical protein [Candidatus Absconditabacterales bacterium]
MFSVCSLCCQSDDGGIGLNMDDCRSLLLSEALISWLCLYRVVSSDIIDAMTVMGTTKLARQQSFRFNQKEQVSAVYVKQGETVRPG